VKQRRVNRQAPIVYRAHRRGIRRIDRSPNSRSAHGATTGRRAALIAAIALLALIPPISMIPPNTPIMLSLWAADCGHAAESTD
jgi:hypothetical protein